MYDKKEIQRLAKEDFEKMKACKTKDEMNALFKNRIMVVLNNSDWHNERCLFVEIVGGTKKESWKMRVRTQYGTTLDLACNEVMITVQTIRTTENESEIILKSLLGE